MGLLARRAAIMGVVASAGLAVTACTDANRVSTSTSEGSTRSQIDSEVEAGLEGLYRTNPNARQLVDQADATLVFPSITKAGLGVGGLYGRGAMLRGDETTGYYNIAGGTFGYQIGAQTFSQAYIFNTPEALARFRETKGFELGAEASAVAADFGASGEVSTSTLQQPLVVVTWGQSGLMAGATVEGAKITEINP